MLPIKILNYVRKLIHALMYNFNKIGESLIKKAYDDDI
jgi:hypothetical protein